MGRAHYRGKRPAGDAPIEGTMSAMQRAVTGLYAKRGTPSHVTGTREDSSESSARVERASRADQPRPTRPLRLLWDSGQCHIPSDLVVDSCPHMLRAAQPLISRWYTTRGRRTSHKIKSTLSTGCNFTTKSGGVWKILPRLSAHH